jgi:hypothetical protein
MTLLTPSTYSSKQTTHSTCLPMCFFHSLDMPCVFFSREGGRADWVEPPAVSRSSGSGTPGEARDRGRDLEEPCSNGVVGEALVGEGGLGEGALGDGAGEGATVWYVRTGSRSTTDFGALHLRIRIFTRNMSKAYTTVSVIKGLTTRTRRVSKKGLVVPEGAMVTQRPSRGLLLAGDGISGGGIVAEESRVTSGVSTVVSSPLLSPPKIFERSPPRGLEEDRDFPDPGVAEFPTLPGTYSPLLGVILPPLGPLISADGLWLVLPT